MKLIDDENRPQGWDSLPATEDIIISSSELPLMVQSEKFLLALRIAAEQTRERGLEAGFIVAVNRDKEFLVGGINIGGTDSMMGHESIPIDPEAVLRAGVGDLLSLHFHPADEDPLPSGSDLVEFTYGTNLIGIGQVDEHGNANVLFISQKEPLDEYTIADYEDSWESLPLSSMGLNIARISFTNTHGELVPATSEIDSIMGLGEQRVGVLVKSLVVDD